MAVGGFVVAPQFPADRPARATDFNDLHQIAGLDAVRACFSEIWEFVC
jgi:putative DNA primase/helicase